MNKNSIKLIRKYAIILAIVYGFELIFDYLFPEIIEIKDQKLWTGIHLGIGLIFNLIIAFIISIDLKNEEKSYPWVIIMTIVIRPLGICYYLILNILNEKANTQQGNKFKRVESGV